MQLQYEAGFFRNEEQQSANPVFFPQPGFRFRHLIRIAEIAWFSRQGQIFQPQQLELDDGNFPEGCDVKIAQMSRPFYLLVLSGKHDITNDNRKHGNHGD
ncbi:MAG: hypothetical protein IIC13_11350 [SAR324 cluster bacterium]|nr:hypothetical protein [SAR324 cluster bacterium]MCH8887178.1 hypothetical protein [SAR324 cluster bacterium]